MAIENRRAQLVHTILNCLGEKPPYADDSQGVNLDRRIKIQKLVYLAQEALKRHRMTLQYDDYNWYIRGPYSPALARDCYALDREPEVELLPLRDEAVELLEPIGDLAAEAPQEVAPHLWLELLASLHYFITRSGFGAVRVLPAQLVDQFRRHKPGFPVPLVQLAWAKLRDAGLLG